MNNTIYETTAYVNISTDFLRPLFPSIPDWLKQQPWAVWVAEPRQNQPGKFDKAPRCPSGGYKIGANKPELFGSYLDACNAYERGNYTGVGVLLTGDGLVGFDIDNYADTFAARSEVEQWIDSAMQAGAYCEVSPSGTGLRLFMKGVLKGTGRKKGHLEIYGNVRFLTVTGHVYRPRLTGNVQQDLIDGAQFADRFLGLIDAGVPTSSSAPVTTGTPIRPIGVASVPIDLQIRLSSILMPEYLLTDPAQIDPKHRALFHGDLSGYGGDHSAADMAFVGYMARIGLSADEIDTVFRASGLYRKKWDEMRGDQTYGQRTIAKALEGLATRVEQETGGDGYKSPLWENSSHYVPRFYPNGMPSREFVGPEVEPGIRLFPLGALSALAALGATGKTSVLISIAGHVAAGKDWNGRPLKQAKVVIFCVEELQAELDRKFSALVVDWSEEDRGQAIANLRLVSLLGKDARLTKIDRGQYLGTGVAEQLIEFVNGFGLKDGLIIFDHMQGFASGDLNVSETAVSVCREANKIVEATGSAVVFAAHISKANIDAEKPDQGFAVGSLAFENAVRQMIGMVVMSEAAAKPFALGDLRKEYVLLGLPKTNYTATGNGIWLKKELMPAYHTIRMKPANLKAQVSAAAKSANEKLADRMNDYLQKRPWATRNQLEAASGIDGPLKASKAKVREVLKGMLDTGEVELVEVTQKDRQQHGLPKQVKQVLVVKSAGKLASHGVIGNGVEGFNTLPSKG